jgi:hypothetical protein
VQRNLGTAGLSIEWFKKSRNQLLILKCFKSVVTVIQAALSSRFQCRILSWLSPTLYLIASHIGKQKSVDLSQASMSRNAFHGGEQG